MSFGGQTPTIIVLKEGTDASQGKGQIISNILACLSVQDTIRSTLGPYGGDLLLVDSNGKQTITNDGATVMKVRPVSPQVPFFPVLIIIALGHCPSGSPNSHRHSPFARRGSWRWHDFRGGVSRRNTEGGQRTCGARG